MKPQYVDRLADAGGTAREYVAASGGDARNALAQVGLTDRSDRAVTELSGGELQLVALARVLATDADLYLIDEPSSYLDIVHRLEVARLLRRLGEKKSVLVVEHDLALLDYLADQAHLLYGESAAFGVVSHPIPMRSAINTYLTGYLKDENVRFRTEPVRFVSHPPKPTSRQNIIVAFPALEKEYPEFRLSVAAGSLAKGETVGIVGPNATGKTTFVRMLAGVEPPTRGTPTAGVTVSYKPQYLKATHTASLRERSVALASDPAFDAKLLDRDLIPGLHLEEILDVPLPDLSGGELQRAAVALALARVATLYLLDEPSAYLDSDERMSMARLIRRQVERQSVSALVVDHDVYFLDLASRRPDGVPARGDRAASRTRGRTLPDARGDEPAAPDRRHHVPPGRRDAATPHQPGGVGAGPRAARPRRVLLRSRFLTGPTPFRTALVRPDYSEAEIAHSLRETCRRTLLLRSSTERS